MKAKISSDVIRRSILLKGKFKENRSMVLQLTEELEYYKYKHVAVQVKNEIFEGILVWVGNSFIKLISEASLVIIPLNSILVLTCANL